MAIGGKFNKPAVKAAGAKAVKKSRYAGIAAAAPRDPMAHVGTYRFRVLTCEEGHNPGKGTDSFKSTHEIVDLDEEAAKHHKIGDVVFFTQRIGGNGASSGLARVKAFIMSAAGFEDEAEYDAFDPAGEYIDACTGTANEYSDKGIVIGRVVDCMVSRGNATADGQDYYREYAWAVVEDSDDAQDTVFKAGTPQL